MFTRRSNLMVVALGIFICGCGDESGLSAADLDAELRRARCEHLVRCGALESVDDCKSSRRGTVSPQQIDGAENGSIKFDADAAQRCLDSMVAASCNPADESARVPDASCANIFAGTVAEGGPCFVDDQCISGNCARSDVSCPDACCPDVCAPGEELLSPAQIGESCIDRACVQGAWCDRDGGDTCASLKARSEPCDRGDQCDYGLDCIHEDGQEDSCGPLSEEGGPCDAFRGDFSILGCASSGLRCNVETFPFFCDLPIANGEACDPERPRCRIYSLCDPESSTCVGLPGVGESCMYAPCKGVAHCNMEIDICEAPKSDGTSCEDSEECKSFYCNGAYGVCETSAICI